MSELNWNSKYRGLDQLLGLTMAAVTGKVNGDEIVFTTTCGREFTLGRSQDCCEHVYVESIVGDLSDLVGEQILVAEVSSSSEPIAGAVQPSESFTWTFYKFATRLGYVDIRWLGQSNGYYSERVDFAETTKETQ
jgi:hypothetical protein